MALKEQMELFEDGGLKDEGNTIDPVSGNDVPPGSTQEEVRDDIPAQLSEGEFVFPADVVRYIGLEKLMQMRQQAKMGLQTMDDMGQMGNSEEAIMPDNLPFELTDLDMDDEEEYNNDTVEMATGGLTGPATGISGFTQSQVQPSSVPQAPQAPTVQQTMPVSYTPPTQQTVSTFTPKQMQDVSYPGVIETPESAPQTVEIINPTTGEKRTITYIPGVTQLPEGFVMASEYTAPETSTVTPTVGQTAVSTRAQDKKDDLESERIRADARASDARKTIIAEMFGEDYLNPNNIAKPFSDLLGKQKPGTVTTGGYIVGDNQEFLNPETGEEYMFGRLGSLREAGFLEKPPLEIKPGGINEKFRQAFEDRAEKQLKAAKTQKEKVEAAKKLSSAKATFKDIKPAKDKKDNDRVKNEITKRVTKAREDAVKNLSKKQKEKEEADTLAFNTGGLASKPKPKPKQMRSGGLASKN